MELNQAVDCIHKFIASESDKHEDQFDITKMWPLILSLHELLHLANNSVAVYEIKKRSKINGTEEIMTIGEWIELQQINEQLNKPSLNEP